MARHASGCDGNSVDMIIPADSKVELLVTPTVREKGAPLTKPTKVLIDNLKGPGVFLGMVNTDERIRQFAHHCFKNAVQRRMPLFLTLKPRLYKSYDDRF